MILYNIFCQRHMIGFQVTQVCCCRINNAGLKVIRYPLDIARYTMLGHKKDEPNPER